MGWPEHRATYNGTTSSWKDDSDPVSESECDPVCSTVFHGVPEGPEKVELSPNSFPHAMGTK